MSKRARITLGIEPEREEADPVTAEAPKTARKAAAETVSGTKKEVKAGRKDNVGAKRRAEPQASAKDRATKKPGAGARDQSPHEPVRETGPGSPAGKAAGPRANPEMQAGSRSAAGAASPSKAGSRFDDEPKQTALPMPSTPGVLNLGTVLKVAAVGLVVMTVVFLLKRKP